MSSSQVSFSHHLKCQTLPREFSRERSLQQHGRPRSRMSDRLSGTSISRESRCLRSLSVSSAACGDGGLLSVEKIFVHLSALLLFSSEINILREEKKNEYSVFHADKSFYIFCFLKESASLSETNDFLLCINFKMLLHLVSFYLRLLASSD